MTLPSITPCPPPGPHPEVIVVGAGPTGLLLACELAPAGIRTRVVEKRNAPHRDSRALNLHPRSMELMDQRGLAGRFLAVGRTVPGRQFAVSLGTRPDFAGLDTRHPYALLLSQARTEALLEERAAELGVRLRDCQACWAVRLGRNALAGTLHPGSPGKERGNP